jgi:hypothetical protein
MRRLTFSGFLTTSRPSTVALPELGNRRPQSIRIVVDLPAPLLPRKPNISPFRTVRLIESTATNRPNLRVRSWASTAYILVPFRMLSPPVMPVRPPFSVRLPAAVALRQASRLPPRVFAPTPLRPVPRPRRSPRCSSKRPGQTDPPRPGAPPQRLPPPCRPPQPPPPSRRSRAGAGAPPAPAANRTPPGVARRSLHRRRFGRRCPCATAVPQRPAETDADVPRLPPL